MRNNQPKISIHSKSGKKNHSFRKMLEWIFLSGTGLSKPIIINKILKLAIICKGRHDIAQGPQRLMTDDDTKEAKNNKRLKETSVSEHHGIQGNETWAYDFNSMGKSEMSKQYTENRPAI